MIGGLRLWIIQRNEHRGEMRNSLVLGRWTALSSAWFCTGSNLFWGSNVFYSHGVHEVHLDPSDKFFSFWLQFSSVQFSHSVVSNSLWPHGLQHTRPPYPSPTPGVYSNSCPLSWWCHPTILSSVVPFSFCLQSFPASGYFQMKVSTHL